MFAECSRRLIAWMVVQVDHIRAGAVHLVHIRVADSRTEVHIPAEVRSRGRMVDHTQEGQADAATARSHREAPA
jgi:hypothetical protein